MERALALPIFLAVAAIHAQTVLVQPYVQPGDGSVLGESDVKVIAWVTDSTPGEFSVEFGPTAALGRSAKPRRVALNLAEKQRYLNYTANLDGLPLGATIHYRVRLGDALIREGAFPTRKPPGQPVRFVVTGDMASGKAESRAVAWQMAQQRPEFAVICGDIVYSSGLVSEYFKHFWPVYNNVAEPGPATGAALMASVPFYAVLGNHDVRALSLAGKPDGFGVFYFFHGPLNGPKKLSPFSAKPEKPEEVALMKNAAGNPHPGFLHVMGGTEQVAAFRAAAGANYPGLCHYSWDNGAVHCVALDANRYTNPLDPLLQQWLRDDLKRSTAAWKLVFFHHPGFNASAKHWSEQRMRLLAPLFEECGVNVVFAGHVHNYQRSLPLRFKPGKQTSKGEVPGKFTVDTSFDGMGNTRPNGVIYIVTGGGGASLYDTDFGDSPAKWKRDSGEPNYIARFVSDRHSFTVVEAAADKLVLRQVDEAGREADAVTITK